MKADISPFTRTPGVAGNALIETHFSSGIITNFESEESFKFVYKIVGLRGSGKSVEYALVMNHFRTQKKWLVYSLASGGNPIQTLISELSRERFINSKSISTTVGGAASAAADVAVFSADAEINTSVNISENSNYYSEEATLKEMIRKASKEGYHILIGIDDIAKNDETVKFLSILGNILMETDKKVRFICTGLEKNIEDFLNVPHLSFFVRNESIHIKPLNMQNIAQKYRQLLGISYEDAVALAKFTLGYAYGYQVLGEICFNSRKSRIDKDILEEFDATIAPQYDLIWSTLTEAEKDFMRIAVNTDDGMVSEIKNKMKKKSGFSSLRDRLQKKHILISESRGQVSVPLPRFREYVNLWDNEV